ncbi:Flp family type IVb pilin [Aestuariivirga litoralis]|uniref:Flp family type IVb pilin n=1 Tax=Aestuariivirga litoralis TaxID=2650924 RepID=A0A2W2BR69_9HYPH|nr:Flp family type IVb pilin [Aestuariivirga litoralis]PZF78719.1 Flp family type IVb pilin [Aestuariivirga litoralis]
MNILARYLREESGATAIEYALLAGLIALVIITAVTQLGTRVNEIFGDIKSGLSGI